VRSSGWTAEPVGRILLVGRLALRDLRRRRVEAALLLLALMAATTTLTLGLVLRDAASDPYQETRAATSGPDVVAAVSAHPSQRAADPAAVVIDQPADLAGLDALAGAPGVVDHSGPFPVVAAELGAAGTTSDVQAVGRDVAVASVDQPALTAGAWVRDGGVVVEAAFAEALDVGVGDAVTLDGRAFEVVGIAVTAAVPPYPRSTCFVPRGCVSGATPAELAELPAELLRDPGLVWLTTADVMRLGSDPHAVSYVMNLALAEPADAQAFVDAYVPAGGGAPRLESWESVLAATTELAGDAQIVLRTGSWLLGLLAVATVSVLVGGRMAEQTARVGLLKAVGGTPRLVVAVLLAQYALVAVVAAAAGMVVGSVTAPLLTEPGAGLLGSAGTPSMTWTTALLVTAVALAVAAVATVVPAVRAARTSTVAALADAVRAPRRTGWLIAVSARLPVPLLLALRITARRPRRAVLSVVSIAITVSGLYVALVLDAFLEASAAEIGALGDARVGQLRAVLLVVMATLFGLAAVSAVFVTWATVLDNRQPAALARALGATPREVSVAVAAAQLLPTLVGAVLGACAGGYALFHAINAMTGGDSDRVTLPSPWQLLVLVAGTVIVVAVLTTVPARLGSRRPVAEALRAELA